MFQCKNQVATAGAGSGLFLTFVFSSGLGALAPLRLGGTADFNYPFRAKQAISFRFTRIVVTGNSKRFGEKYYALQEIGYVFYCRRCDAGC